MFLEEKITTFHKILTEIDLTLIEYLIRNKELVMKSNIADLAKTVNISISMVNKTLKKININGFKELKLLINTELYLSNLYVTNLKDLELEKNIYIKTINDSSKIIVKEKVNQSANLILNSAQNLIWGEGFMVWVGKDLQRKLNKIQINCKVIEDFEELKYIDNSLNTHLIVLSVSGTTNTISKVISFLLRNVSHLKITAITASDTFNWKENLNIHLFGMYTSYIDVYEKEIPTTSRTTIQYICDIVFWQCFFQNKDKNIDILKLKAQIV